MSAPLVQHRHKYHPEKDGHQRLGIRSLKFMFLILKFHSYFLITAIAIIVVVVTGIVESL